MLDTLFVAPSRSAGELSGSCRAGCPTQHALALSPNKDDAYPSIGEML